MLKHRRTDSSEIDYLEKRGLHAPHLSHSSARQPQWPNEYHSRFTGEILGVSGYGIILIAIGLVICLSFWLIISAIVHFYI